MANSPYLDALELLKEIQDELKRLVAKGNAPTAICLLSERVDEGVHRVDNSHSNPISFGRHNKRNPGYRGTFD